MKTLSTKKSRTKKASPRRRQKSHENNGHEMPTLNGRFKDSVGIIKATSDRPKRTKPKPAASKPIPKSFYEEFKQFIGILKDGPPDFAENHKLYASGAKKWKWK